MSDIDNLSNKRIKTVGEMLVFQIRQIITVFMKNFLKYISQFYFCVTYSSFIKFFDVRYFRLHLLSFFSLSPLSQLIDDKNIFSEISHKRRIYSAKAQSLTLLKVREIHPSQLGRICPIETVEGKRAGLVLNFSSECDLSSNGFLRSPFFLWLLYIDLFNVKF